ELIELLLGDRVEFVIVAASAIDGQPQKRLADRGDETLQLLFSGKRAHRRRAVVVRSQIIRSHGQKAARDDGQRIVRLQHVAGDLPANKLVVWHVRVERLDHEVAVFPGVWAKLVALESLAFAVANDVQPVTGPTLAVVWRVEQPIDQALVRAGRGVVDKGLDFVRRRRQADQIE